MPIKKYTGQKINPGQFVNLRSNLVIGACSPAVFRVVSVGKKTVNLLRLAKVRSTGVVEEDGEVQKLKRLIVFVSDSFDEALEVGKKSHAISIDYLNKNNELMQDYAKKAEDFINDFS